MNIQYRQQTMSTMKRVYTSKSQIQNRKILLLKKSRHIGLEMLLVSYDYVTLFGSKSKLTDDPTRSFGTLPILDRLFFGQCRFLVLRGDIWPATFMQNPVLLGRSNFDRLLLTLNFIEYFEHYQPKISTPGFNLKKRGWKIWNNRWNFKPWNRVRNQNLTN